jgi:hypothetical protein
MPTSIGTPDTTIVIDQNFFLAALGGPQHPQNYLDRFPEEIYNKSLDSHLVKFMYALLGPAGIGWLRKNYLEARLKLEDFGIDTFELDKFYGDPLRFGRILEEVYDEDPHGLLPNDKWEEIRAKDAKYRNRALDYVKGARAGNTPLGMHLVARSGLGHEVEVVENYRYLYDQLTDDQLGIPYNGYTQSTEEMIVLPRRETPQGEIQTLTISGSPTGGTFGLYFPTDNEANATVTIHWDAYASQGDNAPVSGAWENIQAALESLPMVGPGNVIVTGGPLPDQPVEIRFTSDLGYMDVPKLYSVNNLTGGLSTAITITTTRSAVQQPDEVVSISPRDQRYLLSAMSRIKPVTALLTYGKAPGLRKTAAFNSVFSTSEYTEVVRYVTGQAGVRWPDLNGIRWIEKGVEHRGPRAKTDLQHHYKGFHNIPKITASSRHIGNFSPAQRTLYPFLNTGNPNNYEYTIDQAPADYAEPLTVGASLNTDPPTALINNIYPTEYTSLAGVPQIKYKNDQFWASAELVSGEDWVEIDLGSAQAINYLYMEMSRKPISITVEYSTLDFDNDRNWQPVVFENMLASATTLTYNPAAINPWQILEYWFKNAKDQMIFARYLRLRFIRRNDINSPFTSDIPFSIEMRNLRVGRNTV